MDVIEYIKGMSLRERETVGHMAGTTGASLTQLIYRSKGNVSFPIAVALDKHSGGKLDFRKLVSRAESVDWDYVKDAINQRGRIAFRVIDEQRQSA